MEKAFLGILVPVTALLVLIERLGAPVTLQLSFKGDLKRESRWLAQFGQGSCTLVVALLIWRLDERRLASGLPLSAALLAAVFGASVVAMAIKRLVGRVRPGRENAGRFLGPTLKHANAHESFPSSHTACAVAMAVVLARFYPPAAPIFWGLAIICALLRYLMDAHWPSDVLAGAVLGYAVAWGVISLMGA